MTAPAPASPRGLSYGTLGSLIEGGYSLTAYCACRPGYGRKLDLPALAARLGPEHSCMYPDLSPRLRCEHCGAHPESFTLSVVRQ